MLIDGVWITPAMTEEVAQITGTHRTTVMRWMERGKLPGSVRRLLRILYHGDLGAIHDAWSGWKIAPDGGLMAPHDKRPFVPGHLLAMGLIYQQLSATKAELYDLREQLAGSQSLAKRDHTILRQLKRVK